MSACPPSRRSERESLFAIGLGSNRPLLASVGLTVALQLVLVYWPPARGVFDTVALSAADLALATVVSSVVFWAVEAEKWLGRRRDRLVAEPPEARSAVLAADRLARQAETRRAG